MTEERDYKRFKPSGSTSRGGGERSPMIVPETAFQLLFVATASAIS
jgi:hypothetical protein